MNIMLETLACRKTEQTPLWLMRQAGRYLPEYRELRATTSDFISYCLDAEKAAEATLQPIHRFDLDAAILFSDILMIPWALDCQVRFVTGTGPLLEPLRHPQDITADDSMLEEKLAPVYDAVRLVRRQLPEEKLLIGFCGAPFTVASYMIEGGSSRDFEKTRQWLWRDPPAFLHLLDRLVEWSVRHLAGQAEAGAGALMVFDSWAGAVPARFRHQVVIAPMAAIISGLRRRGINTPVIGFPRGIGGGLAAYATASGVDAIGLDQMTDPVWADSILPAGMPVQGNLDPAALLGDTASCNTAISSVLDAFANRPHIFNLGHGISQHTAPQAVANLVRQVRAHRSGG